MIVMNPHETREFLVRHGRSELNAELNLEPSLDHLQPEFVIPMEPGKLLGVMERLFGAERKSEWTLLHFESMVWPSWEDSNLHKALRTAFGAQDADYSAGDSYLFSSKENANLISLSYVFCLFRYDFRIIDERDDFHLFFSHDDYFTAKLRTDFAQLCGDLLKFTKFTPTYAEYAREQL